MEKIKNIDLLSTRPQLYIFNKSRYQTIIGSIFTIILIILSLLCLFGFGLDILLKKKPFSVLSRQYIQTPVLNRNDLNIMVAFNPIAVGGKTINDLSRKLNFQINKVHGNHSNTESPTIRTPVKTTKCTETSFFRQDNFSMQHAFAGDPGNATCIDDSYNEPIKGRYGNANFDMFEFIVT
jgi:hypothetical protein